MLLQRNLSKNKKLKKLLFIFVAFLLNSTSFGQRNVLLIIADDLGPDYFGFYENHQDTVDVPNIRALKNRGVRFRNAMTNPVCSSTRTAMLTGRYSFRTGVGGIVGGLGGSNQIDTAEVTIPRLLKLHNSNTATADVGKWHLTIGNPPSHLLYPNVLGYDHFEGPFIGQLPSFTNWTKFTNGVSSVVTNYATSENVNNAVSWLKTVNPENPFFLWLAFNAPHEPLHLPPANLHSFSSLAGGADINTNPKPYFKAMIQAMDHEIGRLFDSLQVLNRMDSTDVIFIGDNGNTIRTAQIADVTKAKGTVYQYGVNVPFIVAGPSVVNQGRATDALVNTADIFATSLELMGATNWQQNIPSNKPVDSKSIVQIIKNLADSIRPWTFTEIFKLTTDSSDGKAMRNINYKLIRFDYGKEEFYKLSTDPLESNDLLLSTLNNVDLGNYNYLCSEMNALLSLTGFCNPTVQIENLQLPKTETIVFPNPFHSFLNVNPVFKNSEFVLSDILGRIIYTGKHIAEQDFSNLLNGIYFLQCLASNHKTIKLIKE